LREMDWLDAKMIDDYDWLGPPTCPSEYIVYTESEPGQHECHGGGHYE